MVLDAAGLSSQSRTRVRTAEDRTREAWQPWRGWRVESRSELTSLPCKVAFRAVFPKNLQTVIETLGGWGHFVRLRCTIALQYAGWQIHDESWASFRGGNWRCDFRLRGGGDSGGSRNSSRRVRAEHAAVRQDRRRSAALARRAAQTGICPNRRAHEEAECAFRPLYQARPRFQSPPAFRVGLSAGGACPRRA